MDPQLSSEAAAEEVSWKNGPYKWQALPGGTSTNTSHYFLVIISIDAEAAFAAAGDVLIIQAANSGNILDSIELEAFGVAASETLLYLPKKLLVPPLGIIVTPHGATGQAVLCKTLADALKIL